MRQLSLTAMMLLISVPAVSADYYHVRYATYACVDPQAMLVQNDPFRHHTTRHLAKRRQSRCFRVRPHENWEQLSQASHSLRLLRQIPRRPNQPPLYFRSSSLEPSAPRDTEQRNRAHHPLAPMAMSAGNAGVVIRTVPPTMPVPAASPAALAPVDARPVPVPQSVRQVVVPPGPRQVRSESLPLWFAPLLVWALIIASAFLMVRLVVRRQRLHAPAATSAPWMSAAADTDDSLGACRNRCVAGLRLAGWEANSRHRTDVRSADVIASHGGRLLAVQCHPSMQPVDAGDIEQACQAREFQGSDLAAIVSNAAFTELARRLAARSGIVLLHEHQLASFAC